MTRKNNFNNESIFLKLIRVILIIALLPIVIIYLIFSLSKKRKMQKEDREKVEIFNISQIDRLSGVEFENLLKNVFERLGYNVSLTKSSHDYGADLIISKGKQSAVVQAKCYAGTVGIKAIQEIISSKNHYGAKDLIVATNNTFSRDAIALATENDVKLIDRQVLADLIEKTKVKVATEKQKFSATGEFSAKEIEQKYPYWI